MNGNDVPQRLLRAFGDGVAGFLDGVQRSLGPVSRPARALGFYDESIGTQDNRQALATSVAQTTNRSYAYAPVSGGEGVGIGLDAYASANPLNPSARLVHTHGRIGFDFGSEAIRDKFRNLLGAPANQLPNGAHLSLYFGLDPSSASSLVWTLMLEGSPIYAIRPAGAFAGLDYRLLSAPLLGQVPEPLFSLSGTISGVVQLLSGRTVPVVGIDTLAQVPAAAAALSPASVALIDTTRRRYQTLGEASPDRARNYVLIDELEDVVADVQTKLVAAAALVGAAAGDVAIDDVAVRPSQAYRPGVECYDVDISFFDTHGYSRVTHVRRWIVDVSRPKPARVGERIDWEILTR